MEAKAGRVDMQLRGGRPGCARQALQAQLKDSIGLESKKAYDFNPPEHNYAKTYGKRPPSTRQSRFYVRGPVVSL
jgi:hypothetical protein